ncbi:MAG: hypothetical protein NTV23_14140 [Propionibacteriales bacterium]|nr:hypothetical protein [Propionibacteriales bacterium]
MSEQSEPSTAGRTVAILLLVLQAASVLVFGGFGLFIAFVSDSCGASSTCDTNLIAIGMMTPLAVALLFFVVSLVQTIKRIRAGRSVWWVPIVWTIVSASGIVLGFVVAASGVAPNGSLV